MFKTVLFFLFCIFSSGTFAQSEPQDLFVASDYSNWVSVDYLNCLKTQLPCQCEKSGEIFLIDLDTTDLSIHLYDGHANQDYSVADLYDFGSNSYYLMDFRSGETEDTLGICSVVGDTMSYIDSTGHQTQFVKYGDYIFFSYLFGHVTWLNEQLSIRGYNSFQEILEVENLGCFCNWELNGVNLLTIRASKKRWILEMQNNELVIYRWVNPPKRKSIDIKIKKKEVRRLKW